MLSAAYGWQPSRAQLPALRVGVQAPVPGGVAADVYVQAPRAWLGPAALGAGVVAEPGGRRTMPYVQAGVQNARGLGGHLVVARYDQGREQMSSYWSEESATVTWLSLQLPLAARGTLHLHGGFARGHVTRQADNGTAPYIDEDRWVRLAGVTLEVHAPRR